MFDWLKEQLRQLRTSNPTQKVLLDYLDREYEHVERRLAILQTLLVLDDPKLYVRADKLAQDISRYLIPTANHYVAGLQRQSAHDRRIRGVLLEVCQRLRLVWIEDILVCLHGALALLPEYRGLFSIPIFFGPPHLLQTTLEVPGIYHEFGHSAFARIEAFELDMTVVVRRHFDKLKQQPGPIPPEQKIKRDQELDRAAKAWSELWLAEIFCDVFAGYVCGPANFASMVDMGAARGRFPYQLASNSHPPNGARVMACYFALSEAQRQHPTVQKIFDSWHGFSIGFTSGQEYRLCCSDDLLMELANTVNALIRHHLPDIPRYSKLPPILAEARNPSADISLEELINAGVTILFEAPHEFSAWVTAQMHRYFTA